MSEQTEHSQNKPKPTLLQVPNLKHVYTMSCGMPARQFFALLKNHGNPMVIDTRRTRYSRGGGFAADADIEYICELHDIAYAHITELAPTNEMREDLKKVFAPGSPFSQKDRAKAWTKFLHTYMSLIGGTRRVLREEGPLRTIIEGPHECIAIICACKHHQDCHRQVTAGMIGKWVEGTSVTHLYPNEVGEKAPGYSSPRRYLLRGILGANIEPYPPRGWKS